MTVYGDLDVTELSELPPGRAPVRTTWLADPGREHEAWERVRVEVAAGRQAYVVCPLVGAAEDEAGAGDLGDDIDDYRDDLDDDDRDDGDDRDAEPVGEDRDAEPVGVDGDAEPDGDTSAPRLFATPTPRRPPGVTATDTQTERSPPRSVLEEHVRLSSTELAGLRVGLLHGQMTSREKESVMSAFRDGELQVLVATTVIEVGVDVTNATVIVIEDADRFGMAQLHQLRGRVGRGSEQSYCYLLAAGVTKVAAARLAALERSRDGFGLAETDLALRGEGTVLGTRQVGRNDLKLASIRRDRDLVVDARAVAEAIVAGDPALESHELLADELKLFVGEEEATYLFMS
jgi:ATP-dependent DNA helicase RecG